MPTSTNIQSARNQILKECATAFEKSSTARLSFSRDDAVYAAAEELIEEGLIEAKLGCGGDVYSARITPKGRQYFVSKGTS